MTRAFEKAWLSDDPLVELDDEDLFGRANLSGRIIEILGRVRQQSASSTVALVGSWGSGKSSVLNGLAKRLKTPDATTSESLGEDWRVAEFNPWMHSGALELHIGFFQALRDALPENKRWKRRRQALANFGRKAAPFGALAGFVGVDGERIIQHLADQATDSVQKQRDAVAAVLEEAKQPILVIIDDLDRLSADELLHVFKLVRLVGRLPYVYYLLSYDERTVVDLLAKTDLVAADNDRRALDYLEKIVQIRLDMPLLRHHDVDYVVGRALTHLRRERHLPLDGPDQQRLTTIFDEVLTERLRSPRALKRVFGQVDAFLGSVRGEVDIVDFIIVTWLRTMEPGVYLLIQRHQKELLRTSPYSLRDLHSPDRTSDEVRDEWMGRLSRAHVDDEHREDILYLLQTLFPHLEPIYRREDLSRRGSYSSPEPPPGRIHHPDYFNRFFSFGVPTDDLADTVMQEGVIDIIGGMTNTLAAAKVTDVMAAQPDLVIRKVWHFTETSGLTGERLITWVFEHWKNQSQETLASSRLEGLAGSLLRRLPEQTIESVARDCAETSTTGALFMAAVCHAIDGTRHGPRDDAPSRERTMAALLDTLEPIYRAHLLAAAALVESPLDIEGDERSIVLYWRLHSPDTLRAALQDLMDGKWDALDTIAWLLPVTDSRDGEEQLSNFGDLSYITDSFDLPFLLDHITEELPAIGTMTPFYGIPATRNVRREAALNLVRLAQMTTE